MRDDQELIWVDKEVAERYKEISDDDTKRAEQIKIVNEYIDQVGEKSKKEFRANLDNLEEDVAIYKGLMLNVKQAFEKAKDEQLRGSYELWEQFEKDLPSIKDKTNEIVEALDPLVAQLTKVNDLLGKIQMWNFDKVIETVERFAATYGESKEMVEFLIKNFKQGGPDA